MSNLTVTQFPCLQTEEVLLPHKVTVEMKGDGAQSR
jgi:hypothetical protein